MKSFYALCLVLFIYSGISAQDNPLPFVRKELPWDIAPQFPGGSDSLISYFKRNACCFLPEQYPRKVDYVLTSFTVDKKGRLKNIRIVNGIAGNPHFAAEALRLLENSPDWIPAKKKSKRVEAEYQFSVPFYRP